MADLRGRAEVEAVGSERVEEPWEEVHESPRQHRPARGWVSSNSERGGRRGGPTELVPPAGTGAG